MKLFIALFILFSILDVGTTAIILSIDGNAEANPLALAIYKNFGLWGLAIAKVLLVGLVSFAVINAEKYRRWIYSVGIGVMTFVIINNVNVIYQWMVI